MGRASYVRIPQIILRTILVLVFSDCPMLVLADAPAAAVPSVMPGEGVLVLRNGEVLQGRITQAGDRYIVTWGEGGEVRVPASDVEMRCRDLDEAYFRKRATLDRSGVGPHLDLAEWCLRHSLVARAADEVLAALAIEPNHPRIRMLERRLQLVAGQPAAPLHAPPQPQSEVGLPDVERALRELPDVAVEKFTVNVQPLLLNRCGANSCHGSASESALRLIRPSWGKTMTRRFTQRNLYSVLQQIDGRSPDKSTLLTVPNAPHGPLEHPVFGERDQAQVRLLAEWAKQVARQDAGPAPKTITPSPSPLLQTNFNQPVPASFPGEAPSSLNNRSRTQTEGHAAVSVTNETFVPRDPFDPELFNRRFFQAEGVTPK